MRTIRHTFMTATNGLCNTASLLKPWALPYTPRSAEPSQNAGFCCCCGCRVHKRPHTALSTQHGRAGGARRTSAAAVDPMGSHARSHLVCGWPWSWCDRVHHPIRYRPGTGSARSRGTPPPMSSCSPLGSCEDGGEIWPGGVLQPLPE
jgi:hypothetical protein